MHSCKMCIIWSECIINVCKYVTFLFSLRAMFLRSIQVAVCISPDFWWLQGGNHCASAWQCPTGDGDKGSWNQGIGVSVHKLAPGPGEQGETKEWGRPLQMVGGRFNEQQNLLMRLVLGGHKTSRPLLPPTRIFNVCIEAVTGFSYVHHPDGLNNTYCLKAMPLK